MGSNFQLIESFRFELTVNYEIYRIKYRLHVAPWQYLYLSSIFRAAFRIHSRSEERNSASRRDATDRSRRSSLSSVDPTVRNSTLPSARNMRSQHVEQSLLLPFSRFNFIYRTRNLYKVWIFLKNLYLFITQVTSNFALLSQFLSWFSSSLGSPEYQDPACEALLFTILSPLQSKSLPWSIFRFGKWRSSSDWLQRRVFSSTKRENRLESKE